MNQMKETLINRLGRIEKRETVPNEIVAFNFGLFEQDKGYCVYLTGSTQYDATDDDWACNIDFEPKEKYIEFSSEECAEMTWEDFQISVKEIVTEYIGKTSVRKVYSEWEGGL